jgi:mutator protein MutT
VADSAKPIVLVAACALVDTDGRVLIGKRPTGKQLAGLWEFPGGKVEAGETPRQAAIREADEELGPVPGLRGDPEPLHRSHITLPYDTFLARVPAEFSPTLNWENEDFAWVTVEQALGMDLHPGLRDALRSLLALTASYRNKGLYPSLTTPADYPSL